MHLVRDARLAAGLTQAELARRMGTTQSAVARLESPAANPRERTLERALHACGRRLATEPLPSSIDETLLAEALKLSPAERIGRAVSLGRFAERVAGRAQEAHARSG